MLNAKNGVISEDRFKNMTIPQWIFHYHEVISFKKKEMELENQKVELTFKMYESLKNTMKDYLEMVAVFANPKAGTEWLQNKELKNSQKELTPEQFKEQWEAIKAAAPNEIVVEAKETDSGYFLPKYDKKKRFKPGIVIK